jgi:molecular chaperone GrpE
MRRDGEPNHGEQVERMMEREDGQDGSAVEGTVDSEIDATAADTGLDEAAALLEQARRDAEKLQAELSQVHDRHLRLAAEFDNYRKRVERERADAWVRAQAELVGRLLDALDDLNRFSRQSPDTPAAALLEGVRLVEKKLMQTLEASGLESVSPDGMPFDPETMEALATTEADSAEQDETVSDVFQRGFRFRGHLVRPARVRVRKYGA